MDKLKLNIDITEKPPTTDELDELRDRAESVLKRVKKTLSVYTKVFMALSILSLAACFYLVFSYEIEHHLLMVITLLCAFVTVIARAVSSDIVKIWFDAIFICFWSVAVGLFAAVLFEIGSSNSISGELGTLLAGCLIFCMVGNFVINMYNTIYLFEPNKEAKHTLESCAEIDPEIKPEECIKYYGWVQMDETLAKYQSALAAQERLPLMAEYIAAEGWMAGAKRRKEQIDIREQAKIACERLRTADL